MREIKFKAVDKITGWVTEPFCPFVDIPLAVRISHNSFEFRQYTGLKDKNGEEIYEGDIIKIFPEANPYWIKKPFPAKVFWHDKGWVHDIENFDKGRPPKTFGFDCCEVISEDPESLGAKP